MGLDKNDISHQLFEQWLKEKLPADLVPAWKAYIGALSSTLTDEAKRTLKQIEDIEREFGQEIARIVDGLTKISNVIDINGSQQAENFKKILMTLTDDPRVILIKLADRLHNMRTLESMNTS